MSVALSVPTFVDHVIFFRVWSNGIVSTLCQVSATTYLHVLKSLTSLQLFSSLFLYKEVQISQRHFSQNEIYNKNEIYNSKMKFTTYTKLKRENEYYSLGNWRGTLPPYTCKLSLIWIWISKQWLLHVYRASFDLACLDKLAETG